MIPPVTPPNTPPITPSGPRVIAVVPDLFFAVRVSATARHAEVPLELVRPAEAAARAAATGATLVLLDLHAPGAMQVLLALKSARADLPVVGFYSHVETALRQEALAAGADAALPRSAFVQKLPDLLRHGLAALHRRFASEPTEEPQS